MDLASFQRHTHWRIFSWFYGFKIKLVFGNFLMKVFMLGKITRTSAIDIIYSTLALTPPPKAPKLK